jgi:hypothetical protein
VAPRAELIKHRPGVPASLAVAHLNPDRQAGQGTKAAGELARQVFIPVTLLLHENQDCPFAGRVHPAGSRVA